MVLGRKKNNFLPSCQGITLVELILAIVLCAVAMAAVTAGYNFLFAQIRYNSGYGNMNLQVIHALENIRLHCLSAVSIDSASIFVAGSTANKTEFCFNADKEAYSITPDDLSDNVDYCYYIRSDDNAFILNATSGGVTTNETLIDGKYNPSVRFEYTADSEPNILTAHINATAFTAAKPQESRITRKKTVRFWFTMITK